MEMRSLKDAANAYWIAAADWQTFLKNTQA